VSGLTLLPGFALDDVPALLAAMDDIAAQSPFRHFTVRGGGTMSAAMTNCGAAGWVSDRAGYRYAATDPLTNAPWPPLPALFLGLAARAAAQAGFAGFVPDVCLLNRYAPGARMGLHQDADEQDFAAPIVSVSLGLPAIFLWGGAARIGKAARLPLSHGDVVVWGGPARRFFHGIAPLKPGAHPLTGAARLNLTFRKAL